MADLHTNPVPPPDVMNDPQYATNHRDRDSEDGLGEADTCRICRSEGTDTEPLFHPCKCSGSIKHVHQDCLMEWLSHSQKKHCELCKTAFRFTKLYSPNMPKSLPWPVLLRHVAIHSVRNVATWLRFCLVTNVWLGCLPYVIRQVWRLLFWISDGGWPADYPPLTSISNVTNTQALDMARELQKLASLAGNGTSPVTPLQDPQTTSVSVGNLVVKFLGLLMPMSQTLNISALDPLAVGFLKSLYYGFGTQGGDVSAKAIANTTSSQSLTNQSLSSLKPSLLSDVGFLVNLTRHPSINQLVITIAEGYIITILVVVCFILVFLIREWVVQQQPGINMGAGFNAEFAAPARGREQLPAREPDHDDGNDADDENPLEDAHDRVREPGRRPMARVRRRHNHLNDVPDRPQDAAELMESLGHMAEALDSQHRPAPVRDALSPAAEIQRFMTEEPRMTEEFLAVWRRADGSPDEVLRIIERENKVDQMRYWVNAMKVLTNPENQEAGLRAPQALIPSTSSPSQSATVGGASSTKSHSPTAQSVSGTGNEKKSQSSNRSRTSSESWGDVEMLSLQVQDEQKFTTTDAGSTPYKGKGKNIEEVTIEPQLHITPQEDFENGSSPRLKGRGGPSPGLEHKVDSIESSALSSIHSDPSALPSSSRPRAVSDGPQRRNVISPLAHGSWTFSNLDSNDEVGDKASSGLKRGCESQNPEPDLQEASALVTKETNQAPVGAPDQGSQAWKAAQDLRVQQTVERAREIQRNNVAQHFLPASPSAQEDADAEGPIEILHQDGVTRTYENWDEVFDANPVDTDSDSETGLANANFNPLQPDTPLPVARGPVVARPAEGQGLLGDIAEYLWGGVGEGIIHEDLGTNDEHIVQDLAAEAPFVPVHHHDVLEQDADFAEPDQAVVDAAIAAGLDPNDPDAIEEAEDFEGIMELIGMRGPIFSLVQNALFSAFLLALTVAIGIWIPYNIGRVSLLVAANPGPAVKLPLRYLFGFAALLQDFAVSAVGLMIYVALWIISSPFKLFSSTANKDYGLGSTVLNLSRNAAGRMLNVTTSSLFEMFDSEIVPFSAASHESLISIRYFILNTMASIGSTVIYTFTGDYSVTLRGTSDFLAESFQYGWLLLASLPGLLAKPESWVISLEIGKRATPLDVGLSVWGATDRFWAIFAGYSALCLLGTLYVKKGSPFSNGQNGREWEALLIDFLNQAGGVMKVILIISIEMLVFPLYCGLLLDAALLPLFEDATIMSRILFTFRSPLTSMFVHWFVGTCYMFHFALFVSMCRRIMRKGVLYFIRDPDDPTFHPVRDVLERNVATQLRKILFSALVYGGLVVVCLGGVVWGLAYAFKGVLPIHWSSNEPVLEFPIDLLFYNFFMPLAVKFFKPSDGLHAMYSWWFRQCARMLRLTWFMFDERRLDEEGYMVHKSWMDIFRKANEKDVPLINTDNVGRPFVESPELTAYFRLDGRYVRAPASDQVRIPKGTAPFLEVDRSNNRIDGKTDLPDGPHGSKTDLYKQVYIPPWFRTRILLFIISIWLFAALTGVSVTILPLVFGRQVFAKIIPAHVRKNDVYAFSIGIYILGSALYAILHLRTFVNYLRTTLTINTDTPHNVICRITAIASRVGRVAWTYTAFIFLLPTLFSFVIEFYFIVPLHTYSALDERHTMHFVQSWTLGLLYVKLATRLILWHTDSRPAQSLRAVTRNGYLDPDARLATRSFILPATFALSFALWYPWLLARLATNTVLKDNPELHTLAYRYAYPMCLCMCAIGYAWWVLFGWVKDWRMKIRDEVYLIGERLHNFGDRKGAVGMGVPGVRRIET
ncbi:hypothetical protein LZ554_000654 [Drepanopeziza brunnea f. sp. 'monogermtubi']|nr:hypothetical protein LZ554_000654 [Drepanopeziza brunnea f. sp. 'monogermtubi']